MHDNWHGQNCATRRSPGRSSPNAYSARGSSPASSRTTSSLRTGEAQPGVPATPGSGRHHRPGRWGPGRGGPAVPSCRAAPAARAAGRAVGRRGEEPLLAARRELAEEVGLAADTWHPLVDLFTTPGIIGERLRIFLARDLAPVDAPDGFVRARRRRWNRWAHLEDLVDAVLAGELHNPTMVSGVLAAWTARQRDGFMSLRPADAAWPAPALLASESS